MNTNRAVREEARRLSLSGLVEIKSSTGSIFKLSHNHTLKCTLPLRSTPRGFGHFRIYRNSNPLSLILCSNSFYEKGEKRNLNDRAALRFY